LFEAVFGTFYNVTVIAGGSPQLCSLKMVAKNKGPLYNITTDSLPIIIGDIADTNNTPFSAIYLDSVLTASLGIFPIFSKNDYDFIFETNDYITNAGTRSRTQFAITGKPIATQTLILSNGVETITFTFTFDPVEARVQPLKLLCYTGSQTNQEQAQAIMEGLQRNYYIDTNYNITEVSFISGTCIIRVEGKTVDTPALLFTGGSVSFFATSGSVINNAARVFGANYRMFLDVYALQGSNYKKVAALDGVPDLSQRVNFRELPMLVDALIPNNLPNISGNVIFGALNFLKLRLKLCDYYGEPPTEKAYNYYPASGYFITLQGAAAQKQITDNYLVDYFIGTTLKMLTAMKSGSTVLHNTQRQYLSIFVPNGTGSSVTVTVKVKLFYTDGTSSADLSTSLTGSYQREQIISVGVGYTQLGIAALKDADKTVSH
jgi:hypothetical protein